MFSKNIAKQNTNNQYNIRDFERLCISLAAQCILAMRKCRMSPGFVHLGVCVIHPVTFNEYL